MTATSPTTSTSSTCPSAATDAPADDPENAVIDELASHGVLSVIAAGNAGDLTDTGGAPGNAVSSLGGGQHASTPTSCATA